jgi:hypothetical protein
MFPLMFFKDKEGEVKKENKENQVAAAAEPPAK